MCDIEQEVWSRSLTSSQVRGAGYFLKIISFLVSTVPKPSLFGGLSYLGNSMTFQEKKAEETEMWTVKWPAHVPSIQWHSQRQTQEK